MYGDSYRPAISNHDDASACRILAAKGLNDSLFFILFTISFPLGSRGSYSMDLLPNALGPASDLP